MNIKALIQTLAILSTMAAMAGATTLYAATQDTVVEVKVEAEAEPKEQSVTKPAVTPKDVTTGVITDKSADASADKNTHKSTKETADKTIKPAKKTDRFIPTESISEDLAVSFPVDI
ncbi:MAG: hypothetical protein HRT35_08265 [Algicola sp.]|nr:hypothetical protein [Algicola sp.]